MPKVIIGGREYEVLPDANTPAQPLTPGYVEPPAPASGKTVTINGKQYTTIEDPIDPEEEPSFEGGLVRAGAQGLTFGFGDELEALGSKLSGGDYEKALKRARRKLERFKEKHPYLAFGAELAGGAVVPIGAGANLARQGLTAGNVAKGALKIGAPTGGLFGLGTAEGIDSPEEAIGPVVSGAAAGAAGYAVGAPIAAGLVRGGRATYDAVRDAFDPRGAAARKTAEVFQDANLPLNEMRRAIMPEISPGDRARGFGEADLSQVLQRANRGEPQQAIARDFGLQPRDVGRYQAEFADLNDIPMNLVDVAQDVAETAGRTGAARPVTDLARSAVAVAREGENATERLMQRQVEQAGRATGHIRRAGGGQDFQTEFDSLQDQINNQARTAYRSAHSGNPQVDISQPMKGLRRQAARRAGDIRKGMDKALALFRDPRGRTHGTLRKYMDARQALDGLIENSRDNLGRDTVLTRELNEIRRRLNTSVRAQNTALASADDLYSGARSAQGLLELGRSLPARINDATSRELRRMRNMTPAQRQMIRLGFLDRLANDIENKRLGHETVSQFRTPAAQRIIRQIVGGDEGERLINDIRREALTTRTLREMYSGSRTAPLQESMKAFEENAQLAAAAMTGNVRGIAQSLMARLRRHIGSRQAREILEMLSAQERRQMLELLDEIEAGGQALALRQGATGFSSLAAGSAAGGQAGQLTAPR